MIRRCPAHLTALVAALVFGLGSQPVSTRADQVGTADYSLTFPNGLPAPSGPSPSSGSSSIAAPQVVLLVDPAGGVVAPSSSSTQGPLTVLPGSHGFESTGVYDYLATSTDSNGNPLQALGLSFYGSGMAAGGVINFSLNVTNGSSPPTLEWVNNGSQTMSPFTPNPVFATADASTSTTSSSMSEITNTPEPLSLLVWSALAGAALVRARVLRRPSRTAANGWFHGKPRSAIMKALPVVTPRVRTVGYSNRSDESSSSLHRCLIAVGGPWSVFSRT